MTTLTEHGLTEYGLSCPNCKQRKGFTATCGPFPTDDPTHLVFIDNGKIHLTPTTPVKCPECSYAGTWDDFVPNSKEESNPGKDTPNV